MNSQSRSRRAKSVDLVHFIPGSPAEELAKRMNYREEKKLEMHLKHLDEEERFTANILTKNHAAMNRNVDRLQSSRGSGLCYKRVGNEGKLHIQLNRAKLTKDTERFVRPTMMSDSSTNRIFHSGQISPNRRFSRRSKSVPSYLAALGSSNSELTLSKRVESFNSNTRLSQSLSPKWERNQPRYSTSTLPPKSPTTNRVFTTENVTRLDKSMNDPGDTDYRLTIANKSELNDKVKTNDSLLEKRINKIPLVRSASFTEYSPSVHDADKKNQKRHSISDTRIGAAQGCRFLNLKNLRNTQLAAST